MITKPKHLYLHVPFCRTICSYCDFCHVGYQEAVANQWLDAIKADIQNRHLNENLETIYIGGGTPTALSSSELDQLLSLLDPYARMVQEYTIEINPETFDEDKAKILQKHGVNRASIGFQTSDERLLQMMNRHHRLEDVAETMRLLRKYGIDNISLDLMYSLPTQTMESLKKSLQDAIALEPTHLSLYSLTIEPNTVFAKKGYEHLEDDMEADMYEWICNFLPKYGFVQYEISNFARPGFRSLHNSSYWHEIPYIGLGASAHSYLDGIRKWNVSNLKKYMDEIACNTLPQEIEILSKDTQYNDLITTALRTKEGIDLNKMKNKYGEERYNYLMKEAQPHINTGKMELSKHRLFITRMGLFTSDDIMSDLIYIAD